MVSPLIQGVIDMANELANELTDDDYDALLGVLHKIGPLLTAEQRQKIASALIDALADGQHTRRIVEDATVTRH
jgi:HD-like signal output (HDOD) protein